MIRIVFVGSILMIAQPVSAFAEKVTLGCALGPEYHVMYYTFDMEAKTVKDANPVEGGILGTFPFQITEDEISWKFNQNDSPIEVVNVYNRQTAQLTTYWPTQTMTLACHAVPHGPL